jgi:Cu+-exporting ATPase
MSDLKASSPNKSHEVVEPQTLQIEGMTCNACVNSVERSLNAIPGVSATVNFAAETAHVLAPTNLNKKELIKAVENAGYKAKLIANNSEITLHSKRSATAFIWSLIFTIPVVAISMVMTWQMKLGEFLIKFFNSMGWPLPTIYNAEFDTRIQANSHVVAHWAAIILTLPVVLIIAYPIHRASIRNFFHPTMDSLISLGSLVAFGWSIYANYMGEGAVYTEVAATVITFVILGRFLESRAKRSASSALQSLLRLGAKEVTVLRGGLPMLIPIDQ